MACILHTIGSRVSFPKDINWVNESAGEGMVKRGTVKRGEIAIIQSINPKDHTLTVKVESTGVTLTVDATIFKSTAGHSH